LNPIVALPVTGLSNYINSHAVATTITETVPQSPNGAWRVVISTDAVAWFRPNAASAAPVGSTTNGTGSFMVGPGQARIFDCVPGDEINVTGAANVSFEYFAS
jgi:hypothetical protein